MKEHILYRSIIAKYDKIFKAEMKKAKSNKDLLIIAQKAHFSIDRILEIALQENKLNKITCKKGCGYCCVLKISITKQEAILILDECKKRNVNINWSRLKRQKSFNGDNYSDLSESHRRCIFLSEKGECKIYEFRPVCCRRYFSVDDIDKCIKRTTVKRFINMNVEALCLSMFQHSEYGSMAMMLLKYKHEIY